MLKFLFKNRLKPPVGSLLWLKCWAKRATLSLQLVRASTRDLALRAKCGSLGQSNALSPMQINGPLQRLSIGSDCAIGRVTLQLHSQISIGNCVVINDKTQLITGSHDVHNADWPLTSKPITIEDYAWIATGAVLLPGVTIGRGAVVGAFAVVTKSVPERAIVVGNPSRIVGTRRVREFTYKPSHSYALFEAWLGPPQEAGVVEINRNPSELVV